MTAVPWKWCGTWGVYVRTPKYRFCSLFWKKSKKIFSLEAFMIFKHCRVMRIFFRFFVLFPKSRNKLLPMYITRESYSCNPYLITTASHQVIRPTYFSYFTGSSPGFLGGGLVGLSAQTKIEFLNSLEFSTCICTNGKIRTIYWLH